MDPESGADPSEPSTVTQSGFATNGGMVFAAQHGNVTVNMAPDPRSADSSPPTRPAVWWAHRRRWITTGGVLAVIVLIGVVIAILQPHSSPAAKAARDSVLTMPTSTGPTGGPGNRSALAVSVDNAVSQDLSVVFRRVDHATAVRFIGAQPGYAVSDVALAAVEVGAYNTGSITIKMTITDELARTITIVGIRPVLTKKPIVDGDAIYYVPQGETNDNEPFSTSFGLVTVGLDGEDGGDDRGCSVRAAA